MTSLVLHSVEYVKVSMAKYCENTQQDVAALDLSRAAVDGDSGLGGLAPAVLLQAQLSLLEDRPEALRAAFQRARQVLPGDLTTPSVMSLLQRAAQAQGLKSILGQVPERGAFSLLGHKVVRDKLPVDVATQLSRLSSAKSTADRFEVLRAIEDPELRRSVILAGFQRAPEVMASMTSFEQLSLCYSKRFGDKQAFSRGPQLLKVLTSTSPAVRDVSDCVVVDAMRKAEVPQLKAFPVARKDLDSDVQPNPQPYGRTLIYTLKSGKRIAVKLRKPHENVSEFTKEAKAQLALGQLKTSLGLQSDFPTPVGEGKVAVPNKDINAILAVGKVELHGQEEALVDKDGSTVLQVFAYEVSDAEYFKYVNQSVVGGFAEMVQGLSKASHDIFACSANNWIYTQLIDLYHSAGHKEESSRPVDGGGRSLVLADAVRAQDGSMGGTGSIKNIHGGTDYPNVRSSGLADLGDAHSLASLAAPLHIVQRLAQLGLLLKDSNWSESAGKQGKEGSYDWNPLYLKAQNSTLRGSGFALTLVDKHEKLLQDAALVALLKSVGYPAPKELSAEKFAEAVMDSTIRSGTWESCGHLLDLARLESPGELLSVMQAELLAEQMICVALLGVTYFLRQPELKEGLKADAAKVSKNGLSKVDPKATPTLNALAETLHAVFTSAVQGFSGGDDDEVGARLSKLTDFRRMAAQFAVFTTMGADECGALARGELEKGLKSFYPPEMKFMAEADRMMKMLKYKMTFEERDDQDPLTGLAKHLGSSGTQMPVKEFEQLAYCLATQLVGASMRDAKYSPSSVSDWSSGFGVVGSTTTKYVPQSWYTDANVWQALQRHPSRQASMHIIAPISDLEDHGNALTAQFMLAEYHRFQTTPGQHQILVPYNLGNNHWVGARLDFVVGEDGEVTGVTLRYMDSLRGTLTAVVAGGDVLGGEPGLPGELGRQLGKFLEVTALRHLTTRATSNHVRQTDGSSCGPFTVENLMNPSAADAADMSPAAVRLRHQASGARVARGLEIRQEIVSGAALRQQVPKAVVNALRAERITGGEVQSLAAALSKGSAKDLRKALVEMNSVAAAEMCTAFFGQSSLPKKVILPSADSRVLLAAMLKSLIPAQH